MTKLPKSRRTKNFARRMLRRLSSRNGIVAKQNEHDRVEFFYVYQRFAALKWLQRGHQIFYTTPKGKGEGVLILFFLRKDVVITPTEYRDNKTLSLTVRGPRHTKEFCL